MHPAKKVVLALIPPSLRPWIVMRVRRWIDIFVYKSIVNSPDRKILERDILPAFAALKGSQLWVGVRRYTKDYPYTIEKNGAVCWTIDIDPAVAKWGHHSRHHVLDLLEVEKKFSPATFDAILCNGVFGYGIDDAETQTKAFQAMAEVIKPGGWLLLGWNEHKLEIPAATRIAAKWFEPAILPGLWQLLKVDGTTHVFVIFRRR